MRLSIAIISLFRQTHFNSRFLLIILKIENKHYYCFTSFNIETLLVRDKIVIKFGHEKIGDIFILDNCKVEY